VRPEDYDSETPIKESDRQFSPVVIFYSWADFSSAAAALPIEKLELAFLLRHRKRRS
jgi:hypothetical protein